MKRYLVAAALVLGALAAALARAQAPSLIRSWIVPRPIGITFDASGNIYVAEFANDHIDVQRPTGP